VGFSIGERLLHVLSARQIMTWSAFKNAFDELVWSSAATQEWTPEQIKLLRNSAVRGLQALAHMELLEVGTDLEVRVAPPALVRLPIAGLPQAVFTGWRSPSLLRELDVLARSRDSEIQCSQQILDTEPSMLPARWSVTAEDEEQLGSLAARLGVTAALRPPAWGLAALAPSLSEYLAILEWGDMRDLPVGAMGFDPLQLRFRHAPSGDSESGLWAVQVPNGLGYLHILRLDGRQAFVNRDWGRWAITTHVVGSTASYDEQAFTLSTPPGLPLPLVIGRAAVLCSGRPGRLVTPDARADHRPRAAGFGARPHLAYDGIPAPLGRQLLAKLRLSHVD
jgi:hypothetical protein